MRGYSRILTLAIVALLTLGAFGLSSPATAQDATSKECLAERPGATGAECVDAETFFAPVLSGKVDGFVTIADNKFEGNQAALYCSDGFVNFAALPDPSGAPVIVMFYARPGAIKCETLSFQQKFPGSELVVRHDKHEGWFISLDEANATMCWRGTLLTVRPNPDDYSVAPLSSECAVG